MTNMPSSSSKTTPLYDEHIALGAKMVSFAGYTMPIRYSGILEEHMAVREAAGLFDVSHMGEFRVTGSQAAGFLQHLITNDISKLDDGKALYTVMCYPNGGAVDDLLVYRISEEEYMMVVNAANIDTDWEHAQSVQKETGFDCTLTNESEETALIALQGPRAPEILQSITTEDVAALPFYRFLIPEAGSFLECDRAMISHTGYTGEKGFEVYCEASAAATVWNALMEAGEAKGLLPCGLGARDTLRLETGLCLYGHELSPEISPLEAGLGWVVKLEEKADFVGRDALVKQKTAGIPRKLIGLMVEGRRIPREGYEIVSKDGQKIGVVTSGTQSPVLKQGIALGLVENETSYTKTGAALGISARGRAMEAKVVKPPFHRARS